MNFSNLNIGFALTGSFCTFDEVLPQIKSLVELGANVVPIISNIVNENDTRFNTASQLKELLISYTGNNIITSIIEAEPIGPKNLLDALVVAPCTGNTLAKVVTGINDTTVTMAIKSTLRNGKPVIISISTNDGLSNSAKNIGYLLNRKNIFIVPFNQDDPIKKTNSIISNNSLIIPTITEAMENRQLQPVISII